MTNANASTTLPKMLSKAEQFLNDLVRDHSITLLSLTCVNCVTELSFILHSPYENLIGSRTFNGHTDFSSKEDLLDELWMTRGMVSV